MNMVRVLIPALKTSDIEHFVGQLLLIRMTHSLLWHDVNEIL